MSETGKSVDPKGAEPMETRPKLKKSLAACETTAERERYREYRDRANERDRHYRQIRRAKKDAELRDRLLAKCDPTNVRSSPTREERRLWSLEEARAQEKTNKSSSIKNWEIVNMPMEDFLDLSYYPSSSDDETDTNQTIRGSDGDAGNLPPGYQYAKAPKIRQSTAKSIARDAQRLSLRIRCEEHLRVSALDEERMLDPIVDFLEQDDPTYWDPRYS